MLEHFLLNDACLWALCDCLVCVVQGIAPAAWATPSITKGTGKGLIKMEAEKAAEDERIKRVSIVSFVHPCSYHLT